MNDIKVTRTYPDPDWPSDAPTTHANAIDTRYTGTMVASEVNESSTYHRFHHGDMVGSTVQLSDNTGGPAIPKYNQAYSAFGERVGAHSAAGGEPMMKTRYQYKGAWGYESGLLIREGAPGTEPIELTHVGARWYDAKVGRFIQRDPIGIEGGLNVYVYCWNEPLFRIDPTGHAFWDGDNPVHNWISDNFWTPVFGTDKLARMSDEEMYAWGIGVPVVAGVMISRGPGLIVKGIHKLAGNGYKAGVHGPHHKFGCLGKLPHYQSNWWTPGVRGSGGVWRFPLPPGSHWKIW